MIRIQDTTPFSASAVEAQYFDPGDFAPRFFTILTNFSRQRVLLVPFDIEVAKTNGNKNMG